MRSYFAIIADSAAEAISCRSSLRGTRHEELAHVQTGLLGGCRRRLAGGDGADGRTVRPAGDTTMTFYFTTGHTLDTLSPMFDVRSGGRTHKALRWVGTSFNFGNDFSRLANYTAKTERMHEMAARLPIDELISNHAEWDGSIEKMNATRAAGPAGKNAFVAGRQVVERAFQVMGECARAQSDRFRM
jgi:metallo-beta-lactamase class B